MGVVYSTAGLLAGVVAGVSVGPYLFNASAIPKDLEFLDEKSDKRDDVPSPPKNKPVDPELRKMLTHAETWTFWPDYERVSMINRMLKLMWPTLSKGVVTEGINQAKIQLKTFVFDPYPFVEDVVVGSVSLRGSTEDYGHLVSGKEFDIGTNVPRIGGIKVYSSTEMEAILEAPFLWGSNCKMDIGVFLKFGPIRLWVPVQLRHLTTKIDMRITSKPLLEELPCIGGVTFSVLGQPTIDYSLKLCGILDVMAIPGLRQIVQYYTKSILEGMFIYPASMSFPIMDNYGLPPPPKGALQVKLLRAENLRHGDDTFVQLRVREGRPMTSKTIKGSHHPEYNESFSFVIDDFVQQKLHIQIWDDDLGWDDEILGFGALDFSTKVGEDHNEQGEVVDKMELAKFIQEPYKKHPVDIDVMKPVARKHAQILAHGASKVMEKAKSAIDHLKAVRTHMPDDAYGKVFMEVTYIPFFNPAVDDDKPAEAAQNHDEPPPQAGNAASAEERLHVRNVTTNVDPDTRGVLTVTLVRCLNLKAPKKGKELRTYVRFHAADETTAEPDVQQTSRTVFHELSPRWGDKLDFVMIKARSVLHITVFNQVGLLRHVLKRAKQDDGEADMPMGRVTIPVQDVVRNGRLRDVFTLQETERGSIELHLQWTTVYNQQGDLAR